MYVGHFAAGVLIKAFAPSIPSAPIMYGVGFLDIIYGLLVLAGVDKVAPNLSAGPYLFFDLIFIDWDHSLVMAVLLSLIWGWLHLNSGTSPEHGESICLVAIAASFSHWICDLLVHNHDLALHPHSDKHFGLGLWGMLGVWSWVLEAVFSAALVAIANVPFKRRNVNITAPIALLVAATLLNSPWTSPMKYVATLGAPTDYIVHAILIIVAFTVPAHILARLIDEQERVATVTRLSKRE